METSIDDRISVILPMASSGGAPEDPDEESPANDALDFNWKQKVNTLYLAAENDTLVPLYSVNDLYSSTHEPKQMVILKNADHFHFVEHIKLVYDVLVPELEKFFGDNPETKSIKENILPFSVSCSPEKAHDFLLGLGLAHFDAHLKQNPEAAKWLAGDIKAQMAERGIEVIAKK